MKVWNYHGAVYERGGAPSVGAAQADGAPGRHVVAADLGSGGCYVYIYI